MPEKGHLPILPPKRGYTLRKQGEGMSEEDRCRKSEDRVGAPYLQPGKY